MRGLRRLFRILFIERRSLTILTTLFFVALFIALSNGFCLMSRPPNVILIAIPLASPWAPFTLTPPTLSAVFVFNPHGNGCGLLFWSLPLYAPLFVTVRPGLPHVRGLRALYAATRHTHSDADE